MSEPTPKELSQKMIKKAISLACPFCSTTKWYRGESPMQKALNEDPAAERSWKVMLICSKCGFQREHFQILLMADDPPTFEDV